MTPEELTGLAVISAVVGIGASGVGSSMRKNEESSKAVIRLSTNLGKV